MDFAQKELFGRFPRTVGSPHQHYVHSEGEFDLFTESVEGEYNAYSSLSWLTSSGLVCDKVSYDLDSPEKESAFPDSTPGDARIRLMREDSELSNAVLGPVCEDAQRLAEASRYDSIPTMGVFSGLGLHIHQFYEPEVTPKEKMETTALKYIDVCDLQTADPVPVGDARRIMRIPNMPRVYNPEPQVNEGVRRVCDLWTIPLTRSELETVTPKELLSRSEGPRDNINAGSFIFDSRSEMQYYESYSSKNPRKRVENIESPDLEVDTEGMTDDGIEWLLKDLLKMPCMYEGLLQPNPPHEIRRNCAVLLFNAGLVPDEVEELYSQLGWVDWNREVTRKQLQHLYRNGYSDMNCKSIQRLGYCTRTDNPKECPTHGWSGGEPEW